MRTARGRGWIVRGALVLAAILVPAAGARAGEPPQAANLRAAFIAQFPKSGANSTALELEERAAALGIDLAPKTPMDPERPDVIPPPPKDGRVRPAPGTELQLPFADFVQRELAETTEKVGRAAPAVERFLEEHDGEIGQIEACLLTHEEPRWELDVEAETKAPLPNVLGLLRLQRLLLTRALVLARERKTDAALETMEASWRLHGALLSRPELISQLLAIAVARLQAGVLRKIDSPAYGWSERLRSPGFGVAGYEAALQNEGWRFPERTNPEDDAFARAERNTDRGFVERLERQDLCSWTQASLAETWNDAASQVESDPVRTVLSEINRPNISGGLLRARQVAIDSELTALVLDARVERAAQRRPHWPDRLLTVGTGVCPEARWTYRVNPNGTVRIAFESRIEDAGGSPFRLPLEFTAGKPRPARLKVVQHIPLAPGR